MDLIRDTESYVWLTVDAEVAVGISRDGVGDAVIQIGNNAPYPLTNDEWKRLQGFCDVAIMELDK